MSSQVVLMNQQLSTSIFDTMTLVGIMFIVRLGKEVTNLLQRGHWIFYTEKDELLFQTLGGS